MSHHHHGSCGCSCSSCQRQSNSCCSSHQQHSHSCCDHHHEEDEHQSFSQQLLELADEAWMEVVKEKIKEDIRKRNGKQLNDLARLVSTTNHMRWSDKLNTKESVEDFEDCLREVMYSHCHSFDDDCFDDDCFGEEDCCDEEEECCDSEGSCHTEPCKPSDKGQDKCQDHGHNHKHNH